MKTLKLNKKPSSDKPTARKAPVRRADPTKRDRSKPPAPKPTFKPDVNEQEQRQRNHKHDGSLHDNQKHSQQLKTSPDVREEPILRSEFKNRAFVNNNENRAKNDGPKERPLKAGNKPDDGGRPP